MESQDVFAQEISPDDDPFAGTDFGDFGEPGAETPAPPQAAPQPTAELPVVDREGNTVPGPATNAETGEVTQPGEPLPEVQPTGLPTLTPEQRAAEAEEYRQTHGEPQGAAPDPTPTEPAGATGSTTEAPQGATEAPVESGTEAPPPSAASETAPPQATPQEDVPNTPPLSEEVVETADAEAPVPEETKDKRGRVTHRRYVVLRVEGPGKFAQIHWYEDDKGKMVAKGPGAKRQTVALARGAEEALKIGYAAVGAPADGATLVAVAAAYFQAKKVKPLPPEPSKQRLQIS